MATYQTTRLEIRTRIRQRSGEPYPNGVFSLNGALLDSEINTYIDLAQRKVTLDSRTSQGYVLLPKMAHISLESGKSHYQLPMDCAEILHVFIEQGGREYEIYQGPISDVRYEVRSSLRQTSPYVWNTLTRERFIITEGFATGGTETSLIDADRSGDATYSFTTGTSVVDAEGNALAVNDVVINLTDDSESPISAVSSSTTLSFAAQTEDTGLAGGGRQLFELGDHYQVVSKEYNATVLVISPPPSESEQNEVISYASASTSQSVSLGTNSSGTNVKQAQSFTLPRSTVIRAIKLHFNQTTGNPIGNVSLRIETNNGSIPSGTLAAPVISKTSLSEITENGENTFIFPVPFRLNANTTYWIVVEIPPQSNYYSSPSNNFYTLKSDSSGTYTNGTRAEYTSSWAAQSASDLLFSVYGRLSEERCRVVYSSVPLPMLSDTDTLEVPPRAEEAVELWASSMCWEKRGDRTIASIMKSEYWNEIRRIQLALLREHKSGNSRTRDVLSPVSIRSGVYINAGPPLYDGTPLK